MSATGEFPSFFKTMGTSSPRRHRQQFCGMFCPVDGSGDSKTLHLDSDQNPDSAAAAAAAQGAAVIDRQADLLQPPRRVEIHQSKGKEALQNLDHRVPEGVAGYVIAVHMTSWVLDVFLVDKSQDPEACLCTPGQHGDGAADQWSPMSYMSSEEEVVVVPSLL
ncbi:unnamed protein product [Merluccius merluccius]